MTVLVVVLTIDLDREASISRDFVAIRYDAFLLAVFGESTYGRVFAKRFLDHLVDILQVTDLFRSGQLVVCDPSVGDFLENLGFHVGMTRDFIKHPSQGVCSGIMTYKSKVKRVG
jgi:hypothetical protein